MTFFAEAAQQGISIPYSHISIHAKSKAPVPSAADPVPQPCLYCQVDETTLDDVDEGDAAATSHEVYIWPADPSRGQYELPLCPAQCK